MKNMNNTLSSSKIGTWKRCWRKYWYKYVRNLVPKKKPRLPSMGILGHEGLRAYWKGEDWKESVEELFKSEFKSMPKALWEEEYEDDLQLVIGVLERYFDQIKCYRSKKEQDLVPPETRFEVPIKFDTTLIGYLDKVIEVPGEGVWLIDHKFTSNDPETKLEKMELNEQLDYYTWALTKLFPDKTVMGAVFNVVRLKLPAKPEPIKSGKRLSKAKITTDYQTYYDAILEYGFDPNDYQKMLLKLKHQKSPFFRREWTDRDEFELREIGRELEQLAVEIPKTTFPIRHRAADRCSWDCEFEDLCLAEKKGGDAEAIIDEYFDVYERDDSEEEETEQNDYANKPF